MGFSLKAWAGHAFKVPKSIRKSALGQAVSGSFTEGLHTFEQGLGSRLQTAGQVGADQDALKNLFQGGRGLSMPLVIVGGVIVIVAVIVFRRRR